MRSPGWTYRLSRAGRPILTFRICASYFSRQQMTGIEPALSAWELGQIVADEVAEQARWLTESGRD